LVHLAGPDMEQEGGEETVRPRRDGLCSPVGPHMGHRRAPPAEAAGPRDGVHPVWRAAPARSRGAAAGRAAPEASLRNRQQGAPHA